MFLHIIGIAVLAILVAVALSLAGGRLLDRRTAAKASPPISTSASAERVVVMPTARGRLEVATVLARETFIRSAPRLLLNFLDLGLAAARRRRQQAGSTRHAPGPPLGAAHFISAG